MSGIFDPSNDFWRTVSAVGDVLGLSILWLFCCLPLVTIGPATAALYYAITKYVRPMRVGAFAGFFRSFRENLKVGMLTTLVLSPVAFAIFLVEIAGKGDTAPVAMTVAGHIVAVLLAGVIAYVFPVLARFRHSVGSLLKTSVSLAIAHLPTTILLALLLLYSVLLCYSYLWPVVLVPGVAAVLASILLERVFRKHVAPEDADALKVRVDD